ncbi:MAG: glycosyltransferase family 9 protein [Ignavibacteriaceae bacterium]|nr:glycosyltransferase family 9 protein [Ignavibacteriaceae bacterium]
MEVSSNKQNRFLIVRPDRIGDVVLSTPIPRELKRKYPDCFVVLLLRDYTKDIYINNPNVDKIIIDEGKASFPYKLRLLKQIRYYKFTHAFMLLPTERINWLLFFSGIRYRIGVGHKFYQFITNTKSVYRRKYIPLRHEADYCFDTVRKIGIESDLLDTEIFLTDEEKQIVKSRREKYCDGKKFLIGIHTTSGNSVPNWKPNTYFELISRLKTLDNIKVVITDLQVPEEIKSISEVIYPEQKTLRDLVHIIASLDLLIASSTGPTHIAAALKIPTITMFCPLPACSPQLWSPLGNKAINILPDKNYCGRMCSGNPKQCYFEEEGGISVENILGAVKKEINHI